MSEHKDGTGATLFSAEQIWNTAIETAAALLELDDEILPYTIEQVRKLKK